MSTIANKATIYRDFRFHPEHISGPRYTDHRLDGEPFMVPAGTQVEIVAEINGRPLLKVSSPREGYRFSHKGEITAPRDNAAPPAPASVESASRETVSV